MLSDAFSNWFGSPPVMSWWHRTGSCIMLGSEKEVMDPVVESGGLLHFEELGIPDTCRGGGGGGGGGGGKKQG